ncbi:MAG: hypothetical protein KAI53_03230 [Candidatus Aenigmarchaeota archaeon]|nr:hypothetical protein [Candidatus Aenigmarchaeota archaeon]
MDEITFLRLSKLHCPKCGMLGNTKKMHSINFFECPGCKTTFTEDVIISATNEEIPLDNN